MVVAAVVVVAVVAVVAPVDDKAKGAVVGKIFTPDGHSSDNRFNAIIIVVIVGFSGCELLIVFVR